MDAAARAIEEAVRLAHAAVQTTEDERVPEIEPDAWSGPAARFAAEALEDLAAQLAGCRRLAADYLVAARRAAAGV